MLKEIRIREATMHRRLVVSWRANSYRSPATERLLALLANAATGRANG